MRLPVSYPSLSRPSGCKILHFSYTVGSGYQIMRLLRADMDILQLNTDCETKSPNWQGLNMLVIFGLFIKGAAKDIYLGRAKTNTVTR